jgi:ATP-dependent NAD(P)H-hydrate dehydratase
VQASGSQQHRAGVVDKAVAAIDHWLDRFDVMIVGPGLGRDELVHETVVQARPCTCAMGCQVTVYQRV